MQKQSDTTCTKALTSQLFIHITNIMTSFIIARHDKEVDGQTFLLVMLYVNCPWGLFTNMV